MVYRKIIDKKLKRVRATDFPEIDIMLKTIRKQRKKPKAIKEVVINGENVEPNL